MDRFQFNIYSRLMNPFRNMVTGGLYADLQFLKLDRNMDGYVDPNELGYTPNPYNALNGGAYETKETLKIENEEIQMETKSLGMCLKTIKLPQPLPKPQTKPSKSQELKSLFTLSSTGNKNPKLKLNDCLVLFKTLYEENKISNIDMETFNFDKENLILNLFCNRSSVLKLLKLEELELKRINYEKWWIFDIWKGNLFKIVKQFKETNQMNDLILNLYQSMISCSSPVSKELIDGYIDQLSSKENSSNLDLIHKAVMYCCTSYQIEKAIDIFMNFNLYLYALCLAQIRSVSQSDLINRILIKYALYSNQVGDYETAVLCYVRLGDFENAYKILIRRNAKSDPEFEADIKFLLEKFSKYLS
ncbi:unnamed protein product [Brachionus calyciflorus]|uniref:Gem-associated protein 5 TPR domain-containing protein n=1 Tax=Brachionus calyciflorus TaxID=104777 RepID=A0A814NSE8_9BILA|nr:unnamed protein product [Brachionus calyciflorus]